MKQNLRNQCVQLMNVWEYTIFNEEEAFILEFGHTSDVSIYDVFWNSEYMNIKFISPNGDIYMMTVSIDKWFSFLDKITKE